MEWPKLKNIILLLLLGTNLFLLILVGSRAWNTARYQSNARSDAIQVLARSGITVDKEVLPRDTVLPTGSVTRNREGEAEILAPLLGEVTQQSLGGGRFLYTGERGEADLRGRGEFTLTFAKGAYPLIGDPATHGEETLALMGIQAQAVSIQPLNLRRPDDTSPLQSAQVSLVEHWQGVPILSCTITAVYEQGMLVALTGTHLAGEPQQTGSLEFSAVTGLLRFLEELSDTGDVCSAVTAMTPAYQLTAGLADPSILSPVWHIETDVGAYTLDVGTNKLDAASSGPPPTGTGAMGKLP